MQRQFLLSCSPLTLFPLSSTRLCHARSRLPFLTFQPHHIHSLTQSVFPPDSRNMAPRIVHGNAAARARPHFSTKPESTVHASDIFKNFTQRATTTRSKAAPPTKYDLTSKPQGITKNRSQGRNPLLREREKRRSKPEHPLSTLFTGTHPLLHLPTRSSAIPHCAPQPKLPQKQQAPTVTL